MACCSIIMYLLLALNLLNLYLFILLYADAPKNVIIIVVGYSIIFWLVLCYMLRISKSIQYQQIINAPFGWGAFFYCPMIQNRKRIIKNYSLYVHVYVCVVCPQMSYFWVFLQLIKVNFIYLNKTSLLQMLKDIKIYFVYMRVHTFCNVNI